MGSFRFTCPFCNQHLDCDDSLQNQIVACPSCNNEIVPTRNPHEGKIQIVPKPVQESANPASNSSTEIPANGAAQVVINNYGGAAPQPPPAPPFVGNANMPKSRLTYVLLGIFLGGYGVHNFYAGYKTEASIQLAIGIIGLLTLPEGFFLNMCVGVWALANIICRKNDVSGRPMI